MDRALFCDVDFTKKTMDRVSGVSKGDGNCFCYFRIVVEDVRDDQISEHNFQL